MSYRSIKRVLGETSLERKCRFLFGACLLLLIIASFWVYGWQTEKLVRSRFCSLTYDIGDYSGGKHSYSRPVRKHGGGQRPHSHPVRKRRGGKRSQSFDIWKFRRCKQ